jgi:hypothetical protein
MRKSGASPREVRAALQALVNAGHSHTFVTRSPAFGHAIRVLRQSTPADPNLVLLPVLAEALRTAIPYLDQLAEEKGHHTYAGDAARKAHGALTMFET